MKATETICINPERKESSYCLDSSEFPRLNIPFRHFWMEFFWNHITDATYTDGEVFCGQYVFFDEEKGLIAIQPYLSRIPIPIQGVIAAELGTFTLASDGNLMSLVAPLTPVGEFRRNGQIDELYGVTLLALGLMSCKNAQISSIEPSRQIRRQAERDGVAYCSYKIVSIGSPKRTSSPSHSDAPSSPKAFHICRGHFKTFDDKPLFGLAKGTYWWSDHARGDYESGVVVKDYKVSPQHQRIRRQRVVQETEL